MKKLFFLGLILLLFEARESIYQTNLKDETSIINFLCIRYQVEHLHKDLKGFNGAGFNSYADLKSTGLEFAPFGQFDLDSIFTIDQRKALEENLIHTSVRRIRNSEPFLGSRI